MCFIVWHSENEINMAILGMVTLYYQSSYFQGNCEDVEHDVEETDDSKCEVCFCKYMQYHL